MVLLGNFTCPIFMAKLFMTVLLFRLSCLLLVWKGILMAYYGRFSYWVKPSPTRLRPRLFPPFLYHRSPLPLPSLEPPSSPWLELNHFNGKNKNFIRCGDVTPYTQVFMERKGRRPVRVFYQWPCGEGLLNSWISLNYRSFTHLKVVGSPWERRSVRFLQTIDRN